MSIKRFTNYSIYFLLAIFICTATSSFAQAPVEELSEMSLDDKLSQR